MSAGKGNRMHLRTAPTNSVPVRSSSKRGELGAGKESYQYKIFRP